MDDLLSYHITPQGVWCFARLGEMADAFCFESVPAAIDFHRQREETAELWRARLQRLSRALECP